MPVDLLELSRSAGPAPELPLRLQLMPLRIAAFPTVRTLPNVLIPGPPAVQSSNPFNIEDESTSHCFRCRIDVLWTVSQACSHRSDSQEAAVGAV